MSNRPPLERAARALCSLAGNPENATMNGNPLWMDYLPEARAVIEAIREPSEEQLDATGEALIQPRDLRFSYGNIYRAMIDQLLSENE